jgi:hypothetical protein
MCLNSIVPILKACEIPRLYDMYERLLLYEALVLKTLTEGQDLGFRPPDTKHVENSVWKPCPQPSACALSLYGSDGG